MHEDGYGASDKEQELNDLNEYAEWLYARAEEIRGDWADIDKYFNFADAIHEFSLDVQEKEKELRNPQDYEDAVLEREGL